VKKTLLILVACVMITAPAFAVKYAVKLNGDNKITSSQPLADEYVATHKDDSSNPLNMGYALVDDITKYEEAVPEKVKTDIEKRVDALETKTTALESGAIK
jgi:hypothetical protein